MVLLILPHMARRNFAEIVPLAGGFCGNHSISHSSMDIIKPFATFVLPLMGIVSSEASCERAFWQQRRILGDQGTKTSIEVEKAKHFFAVKH